MNTPIADALQIALAHCKKHGLSKSADMALVLESALDTAGFKIVRKPGHSWAQRFSAHVCHIPGNTQDCKACKGGE